MEVVVVFDEEKVKESVRMFLEGIGEDLTKPDLVETPERMTAMYKKILSGYDEDPNQYFKVFEGVNSDMVIVKNINFYSYCAHHGQPFYGVVSIGYVPNEDNNKIIGLSKLVRIMRVFAKRLQTQEVLTNQIASCLFNNQMLAPQATIVRISAHHTCMAVRGVRSPGTITETMCIYGALNEERKNRFIQTTQVDGMVFRY